MSFVWKRVAGVALLSSALLCTAFDAPGGAARRRAGAQADAATLYLKHCATCHGKDGRARTFKSKFKKARDLTDARWQGRVTDERLFNSVAHGRGRMPAFNRKLDDRQVESLVAYVRGLKK